MQTSYHCADLTPPKNVCMYDPVIKLQWRRKLKYVTGLQARLNKISVSNVAVFLGGKKMSSIFEEKKIVAKKKKKIILF